MASFQNSLSPPSEFFDWPAEAQDLGKLKWILGDRSLGYDCEFAFVELHCCASYHSLIDALSFISSRLFK